MSGFWRDDLQPPRGWWRRPSLFRRLISLLSRVRNDGSPR